MLVCEGTSSMEPRERVQSGWSFQIARALGIPIRVHFTFLLLLAWFAFAAPARGQTPLQAVFLLLMVFLCVLLHELGHAAAARRFGIPTHEVVLYPFGGVARLDSMPSGRAELLIALAGPAVNVVIALALFVPALALLRSASGDLQAVLATAGAVPTLFTVNVMLVLFNLLPAFPMDGGRVLRALLSMRLGQERATEIAASIGQWMAMLLGAAGLFWGNVFLLFAAFFVFLGAGHEAAYVRQRESVLGRTAREAMITRFETLAPTDTLATAGRHLLETHQADFPVIDAWNRVAGVLTRGALMHALAGRGPDTAVLEVMERGFRTIGPDEPMERAMQLLRESPSSTLLVLEDGRLQGMITLENLAEFIEIARNLRREALSAPRPS